MCAKEPDDSNSKIIESFFTKKEFKIEKKYFIRVHFFITDKRKVLESVLTCLDLVYLGLQTDTSCCE